MRHRGWPRQGVVAFLALAGGWALAPAERAAAGEIAVEALAGYQQMAASRSAKAVFGSDHGATLGGALRYTFWRGAFASAGARTFSKDGERVFVATASGPVQRLGFPLQMRTTPLFLDLGYRFRRGRLVSPYLSAGYTITKYKETSSVAGQGFDKSASKPGFVGALGVELGRGLLRFAAEGGWSTVPSAIAVAGVSKVYGEDDLGGIHVTGKVVLAFGGRPVS